MSTAARPDRAIADLNMERLVAETVPAQIRATQEQIAELERSLLARRAQLRRLLDTAVLYGVELCPPPRVETRPDNGSAASPGRADDASVRGVAA